MSLEDAKRRILDRVPLATLIGERIKLTSRAGRLWGLCPFHEEKGPSFTLYDDHYFCFGCKARGDAIDFVRHERGLGFKEALRYLAEKFAIEVPELDENEHELRQRRRDAALFQILGAAQAVFTSNLHSPAGEIARGYLKQRGFGDAQIQDFGFGLALPDPHALERELRKRGFQPRDIVDCSLANPSQHQSGNVYDFFVNRIMIPIRDKHGRVIAFGGRTLDNDPAKYKNSRETVVFDKSRTLFGLDQARNAMRTNGRAIVVEGYMDTLQLWNHGIPEAVACLGTALTIHHLKILSPIARKVYLCFDGDFAGQNAARRTVELAFQVPEIEIKVMILPTGDDPDSFVVKNGKAGIESLMTNALDLLEFVIAAKLKDAPATAIPSLVAKEFIPWITSLADPLQQSLLYSKLSQMTRIPVDELRQYQKRQGIKPVEATANSPEPLDAAKLNMRPARPLTPLQYDVLGHLYFAEPGILDTQDVRLAVMEKLDLDEIWQTFALEMLDSLDQGRSPRGRDRVGMVSTASTQVMELIETFEKKQTAFAIENRREALERLVLAANAKSLKNTISYLKSQLLNRDYSSPDWAHEQQRIVVTITQLQRELMGLEKSTTRT